MSVFLLTTALTVVLPIAGHSPAAAQAEQARTFDIPGQGLSSALRQFARQSGLQLAYTTADIGGLKSAETRGTLTPRQALARLLAGTGVSYRFTAPNVVALQRPGASDNAQANAPGGTVLEPISVEGQSETATGPVRGYIATRSGTGTKTDTPLAETPQSVTVVTADQVKDQGAKTVQETLRYVPGTYADAYGPDMRGDYPRVRGSDPNIFLDGTRAVNAWQFNEWRPDPYTMSRIEVLRGPSSVLYGDTSTAGLINMVSKLPQAETYREVGVQYGSFNRKQIQADMTGKLSADGQWLYRMIGVFRDSEAQTDFVKDDRVLFQPAITWKPTQDTSWTLIGLYQKDKSGSATAFLPHEGTLFPGPNGRIPINRFVSEPGYDLYQTTTGSISSLFEHRFNEALKVRQSTRFLHTEGKNYTMYPDIYYNDGSNPTYPFLDPTRRTVARSIDMSEPTRNSLTSDTNMELKFATAAVAHKMLAGIDHRSLSDRGYSATGSDTTPFDLYSPSYNGIAVPELEARATTRQKQTGLYVQDQMRLGNWIAVAGIRYDSVTSDVDATPRQNDQATTSRLGLMYELPGGLTPYVSWAQSFNPVFGADMCVDFCKPTLGELKEVGFKYNPWKGLVVNGAVYEIEERNRLASGPDPLGPSIQTGEVRIRGAELEVLASVTPELDVIASYAYTDARVTQGDNVGNRVELVPLHMASVWAKYKFGLFGMRGFTVGAGARYIGESWDGADIIQTPAYTLFDAMLGYENEQWRFQLNGTNLADKEHVTTCLARGDCFYGARRTFMSSLTYKF